MYRHVNHKFCYLYFSYMITLFYLNIFKTYYGVFHKEFRSVGFFSINVKDVIVYFYDHINEPLDVYQNMSRSKLKLPEKR